MTEKYITKNISVFVESHAWVFGISFYDNPSVFNIQILCFGICFWRKSILKETKEKGERINMVTQIKMFETDEPKMTREEAIEQLEFAIELIKKNGKDYLDERDIPILEIAISALSAIEDIKVEIGAKVFDIKPKEDGSYFDGVDDVMDIVDEVFHSRIKEKGTDGTLVYNANGHFYGVMGGDAIMERIRGKDNERIL